MASPVQVEAKPRKLRMLCLHGLRTSGSILQKQISKWPKEVHDQVDFFCIDAPFPAQGKSDVEGLFDPPYFEWVLFNEEHTEYTTFQETLDYLEDCCIKYGPIDGLLGFSQGGILVGALPGLQQQGLALTKVPKIKFVIIIAGGKLRSEKWKAKAYVNPLSIPNLHFLGKEDFMRPYGMQLLKSCKDPIVIHHPKNHIVPRIVPDSLPTVLKFIDQAKKLVFEEKVVETTPDKLENICEKQTNGDKQEINGKKQEINGEKQEINGKKQEINGEKQEINDKKQEINGEKQASGKGVHQ